MSFLDFTVYVLGVYGIAWIITQSNIGNIFRILVYKTKSEFLAELVNCIVCTSVWISFFFVWWYFPAELWYTKFLLVGTTVTTTWALANLLGDID